MNDFKFTFRKIAINFWHPPTAIYRYTSLLSDIGNGIILNVVDDKEKWNTPHIGVDMPGKFLLKQINTLFPKLSHMDLIKYINSVADSTTVIHYTSQRDVLFKINKNTVVTVHDNPFSLYKTELYFNKGDYRVQKLHRELTRRIFEHYTLNSPYVITDTDYVKKSLIRYGYKGKVETIYIPVSPVFRKLEDDQSKIRNQLGLPLDKILLLSVSNRVVRKNLELVERLGKLISDRYLIVRVGGGIEKSIHFNNVDDETLNKLYNACDVLLFPSKEEGQGLPVIEAFKTGLPVVASDIEVLREVAGDAAIFIDPDDENSLLEGVEQALDRKDQLRSKCFIRSKMYSRSIFKDKMANFYQKIISEND